MTSLISSPNPAAETPMRFRRRHARILAAAAIAAMPVVGARAQDVSASAILQFYEASWKTIERRTPDVFMAGYGHIWTPPPGRAEQGNLSVGYDVYDRFDLGSTNNATLYGTETGLKTTIVESHKAGLNVYTDLVWNHNGFADQGTAGFTQSGGYPGFILTGGPTNDGDFHSAFAGGDYAGRTSNLIDIDHATNNVYVRNPVPGFANNLPAGTPSSYNSGFRVANVATEANRRFYPDLQGPSETINGVTYHRWSANPANGDPVAENATGYLMRHTRWMIEEIGVDGFRLDATKHLIDHSSGNPDWVLEFYDVATNAGTKTPLLDGSKKRVFGFGEYLDSNVGLVQTSIKKDANANRDALDFAMHYALKNNLTGNGAANDWRNIVNTTQDTGDDGLANNGSQGVSFDRSHDDGGAYLSNVANAYLLMRPGNAVVYFNAKEFGNGRSFPKDGNGDALGGFYGDTVKKLVEIRNTHGRGNYAERWIDQNTLVFERAKSAIAGYNSRVDNGYDQRTVNTGFTPGVHLVELTGNATDATVDPNQAVAGGDIFDTVTVQPNGQITMRIPRNKNPNGVEHDKGYVIYGLQNPKGTITLSNVARTLAPETPTANTNGTARLTAIDIIKANSFNFTLNTQAVTLSDGWRDLDADGDNALLKVDGGLNINGNGGVDFTGSGVVYGFEQFVTQRTPGYGSASGNGTYVQTIDTTQLSEGYHYLTARAFRHADVGGTPVYTDFRKVIYVDRLRPQSAIVDQVPYGTDDRDFWIKSLDKTADSVHIFQNLPANLTEDQIIAMVGGGSSTNVLDRDIYKRGFSDIKDGNNVYTLVTFEVSYDGAQGFAGGGVNVQRLPGFLFASGGGLGLADLNFNDAYELGDVNLFQTQLQNNNSTFNPAADLNADGLMSEADNVLNVPWLVSKGASSGVINSATQLRLTRAMALDGTLEVPAGTLNVSGTNVPATPLTFNNSFNILANETINKTGGQALNISAPQSHGTNAVLNVNGGTANFNTNGGANLTVNTNNAGSATNFTVSQTLKSVGVGTGGVATLTPSGGLGGGKSIGVTSLNMTGGKLDVTNNNLAVNWTGSDPTGALASQIALAHNGGEWNGPAGITSSTAAGTGGLTGLGIGPASQLLGLEGAATTLWAGQTVDATSTLIKYTYVGDANLDGFISGDDYASIDGNIAVPGASGYFNGDFNYDGIISGDDYAAIDSNIVAQGAPIPTAAASFTSSGASVVAVPEPSTWLFATVAGTASLLRRRRRKIESCPLPVASTR